jgi:hypothetical protein
MEQQDLIATHQQLVSQWQIVPKTREADRLDYDLLLEELQERVLYLLQENPRKLMTALYLLDVSERRYAVAMDQPTMEDRAWDLARAILERESEKIITRRRYAEQSAQPEQGNLPPPEVAP